MPPTVAVLGTFRFPPESIPAVLPHLKALIDATRAHDGCIVSPLSAPAWRGEGPGVRLL